MRAESSTQTYDYCDEPEFVSKTSPDGLKIRFYLEGLNCTACVWLLEKLPDFCADAKTARVDIATSTIAIERTSAGSFGAIATTLDNFGYRPHPLRNNETSQRLQTQEHRRDLIRLGVAAAATGNIMILAVSIYGGASGALEQRFQWLAGLIALPVLTYCAWPFYLSALRAFRARRLNLDVPIVVAILAGVATSVSALARGESSTYFDSLSMLVFLLLSSRLVLKGVQTRHLQSVNIEDDLLVGNVKRSLSEGLFSNVSTASLKPGDLISVRSGDLIPVDGIVESGFATINASVMTGESDNMHILTGAKVEAGWRNLSDDWLLRVEKSPRETRLAGILRDTELASEVKSRFITFSDSIAQYFIAIVLGSAALLVVGFISTDPREGFSRALALIIVTCPCVFGIAIPLSMGFAIRSAARKGIIIKNADAIERLWSAQHLFFDKTATLTTGAMEILSVSFEDSSDLAIVAGLERDQTHPVARAITNYTRSLEIEPKALANIAHLESGGVCAEDGNAQVEIRPIFLSSATSSPSVIRSTFGFFKDNHLAATFELGDRPRLESREVLDWARSRRLHVRLLSGDREHVVFGCARTLGFSDSDVYAERSPEAKVAEIRKFPEGTVMIGDGANDAAAFAAASVGIAVCGSLDVSLRAADIYLTRQSLWAIPELFEISRITRRAIIRNLVFSASFNVIAGLLAATGQMTPLWAAVFMPLSSLTVLLSAFASGKQSMKVKGAT